MPEIYYLPTADDGAYSVYTEALGERWPLSRERFHETGCRQMVMARQQDEPLGCALLDSDGSCGYVQLLAVRPRYQCQGVGTALLAAAERWLEQCGATRIYLGRGRRYLWQGVPEGAAEGFFLRRGYLDAEISLDMTLPLAQYAPPAWAAAGLPSGICLRRARPDDEARLPSAFGDEDLAGWLSFYLEALRSGQQERILLAIHEEEIVGFVLVLTAGMTWQACFAGQTGGLGCLGVIEAYRGRGIGRALAAAGTLLLRQAGMDTAYLGWTWLEDWYGALGYRTWRRFHMMHKNLSGEP